MFHKGRDLTSFTTAFLTASQSKSSVIFGIGCLSASAKYVRDFNKWYRFPDPLPNLSSYRSKIPAIGIHLHERDVRDRRHPQSVEGKGGIEEREGIFKKRNANPVHRAVHRIARFSVQFEPAEGLHIPDERYGTKRPCAEKIEIDRPSVSQLEGQAGSSGEIEPLH